MKCGACRAVCPSFLLDREESLSARGRMALVRAVAENRLALSAAYKGRLSTCTGCLACEAACPSGVGVTGIIQTAKEQAVVESGGGVINAVLSAVIKNPSLFHAAAWLGPVVLHYARQRRGPGSRERRCGKNAPNGDRAAKGAGIRERGKKGRVAIFSGCAVRHWQQDIGEAATAVLNHIGYEVVIPEELKCCGRPMLTLGDRKSAEELAAHNAAVLGECDVDAIVTACASCGLTFKQEYPKLLPSGVPNPLVIDIHAFLSEELAGIMLNPVSKTITWHDPCHLGRGQGLSRTAREVLRSIPALTLVEMKNADRCCGFGGLMRITRRELSDGIGAGKAKSIIETGASVVATGCPACRMQIADSLERAGSGIEVVHTVQLIARALSGAERGKR